MLASDLSGVIEGPQTYRVSSIPRSITWEEVGQVLDGVDRRTPCGKRDWVILLLLARRRWPPAHGSMRTVGSIRGELEHGPVGSGLQGGKSWPRLSLLEARD